MSPAAGVPRPGRGPLMTQRRHGGFGQKLYVYVADHQLAAKCAADAAMEISFQDARSLRGRSRRPPLYARSPVVMLRVALPSPRIRRTRSLTWRAVAMGCQPPNPQRTAEGLLRDSADSTCGTRQAATLRTVPGAREDAVQFDDLESMSTIAYPGSVSRARWSTTLASAPSPHCHSAKASGR